MKIQSSLLLAGFALAAAHAHGQIFNIFSDAGDESNLNGNTSAQVDPIPSPLSGTGWGVMNSSDLDGAALRMWNVSGTSRAEMEYVPSSPLTTGVDISFQGLIESGFSGQNLWRVGPAGANLGAFSQSAMEFRLRDANGGEIMVRSSSAQDFDTVAVGLDTAFTVSLIANPQDAGGTSFDFDKNGVSGTLNPQEFSVIVNDTLVGTYGFLNAVDNNIGASWMATGTGANQVVPTLQIDDYTMTAVPEPGTYALIFGAFGMGIVLLRRRRR